MTVIDSIKDKRKKLAIMLFCRSYLYYSDLLTEVEAKKVFKRIRSFQDKHKIAITQEQIDGVIVMYDDKHREKK